MAIDRTKRQQKNAMRRLLLRLLTSAILGMLIVASFFGYDYLTTSDKLAISQVEIEGLSRLEPEEMERLVADLRGQNILLVQLELYAARFDNHPRVMSANFRRILPNRVVCTVKEREPVALVFTSKFIEVGDDGTIMRPDDLTDMLDLPIITGLNGDRVKEGGRSEDEQLHAALEILDLCKKYGGEFAEEISELRVTSTGINIVSLQEGMVLLLGETDYERRLKKFFLMRNTIATRDESAKLVDLRFDDQIVLRTGI